MPRATQAKDEEIVTQEAAEVMRTPFDITPEQLDAVTDFDSAMRLASEVHGEVETSKAVRVAGEREKLSLVGQPIVLLEWQFVRSDKFGDEEAEDREYVDILCATKGENGEANKWRMTDGSTTGILKQLRDYTERTGKHGGVFVPLGIRVSEYPIDPTTRRPLTREAQRQYDRKQMKYPYAKTFYVDI